MTGEMNPRNRQTELGASTDDASGFSKIMSGSIYLLPLIGGIIITMIATYMCCRRKSNTKKAEADHSKREGTLAAEHKEWKPADGQAPAPAPAGTGPWVSHSDPNTGKTYFHNAETNVTQWDKPDGFTEQDAETGGSLQMRVNKVMV
jgi:hypothetical protein